MNVIVLAVIYFAAGCFVGGWIGYARGFGRGERVGEDRVTAYYETRRRRGREEVC